MSAVRTGRAGAGATAKAAQLARQERPQVLLVAAAGALPGILIGTLTSSVLIGVVLALAGAVTGGVWQRGRGTAARWRMGAGGERRTGRHLNVLRLRPGWTVLHDRALPGTRANVDHLVISPDGTVWNIDAKVRNGRVKYNPRRNYLQVGRTSGYQLVASTVFETERIAEALQAHMGRPVPVRSALAVHRAAIPTWHAINLKGVRVLPARAARRWLLAQAGPRTEAGREVAAVCQRLFPPYP